MEKVIIQENRRRLIAEREKKGWSQSFVAQTIGCSREYYNKLENGKKNNPKARVVKNLAHLFAVRSDIILRWLNV